MEMSHLYILSIVNECICNYVNLYAYINAVHFRFISEINYLHMPNVVLLAV